MTYDVLIEQGAPVVRHNSSTKNLIERRDTTREKRGSSSNSKESIHGTQKFAKLTNQKLQVVRDVLLSGYDVLYSDVDIVFHRDPTSLLRSKYLMQFASDGRMSTPPSSPDDHQQYLCTGFFYARAHLFTVKILRCAILYGQSPLNSLRDDQIAMNAMLPPSFHFSKNNNSTNPGGGTRIIGTFRGVDVVNGYTYYHRMVPQKLRYQPYVVHANYILGAALKRRHMIMHGNWRWLPKSKVCAAVVMPQKTAGRSLYLPPMKKKEEGNSQEGMSSNVKERERERMRKKRRRRKGKHEDGEGEMIILTCSTSKEMLQHFYSHYSRFKQIVCGVHLSGQGRDVQAALLHDNDHENTRHRQKQKQTQKQKQEQTTCRNILQKSMTRTFDFGFSGCRSLRPRLLSSALSSALAQEDGRSILWLDVGVLFLISPTILRDYKVDILMSSSWRPRRVVADDDDDNNKDGTERITTVRVATSVATILANLKMPPPLPGLDLFFVAKTSKEFKSLVESNRLMELQISEWIGGAGCPLETAPGSWPFVQQCKGAAAGTAAGVSALSASSLSSTLTWGMLDPLVYVRDDYYQLSLDVGVNHPHAVRYQVGDKYPERVKWRMLMDGLWMSSMTSSLNREKIRGVHVRERNDDWQQEQDIVQEQQRREKWMSDWKELQQLMSWMKDDEDEDEERNIVGRKKNFNHLKKIFADIPSHRERRFVCMFQHGPLRSPVVPLLFLQENNGVTVHYFTDQECRDQGTRKDLAQRPRCVVVRRFLQRRTPASSDIQYHHYDVQGRSKEGVERKEKEVEDSMVRSIVDVSTAYPFVKCDVALIWESRLVVVSPTGIFLQTLKSKMMRKGGVIKFL